jgi:hypothetical protein
MNESRTEIDARIRASEEATARFRRARALGAESFCMRVRRLFGSLFRAA